MKTTLDPLTKNLTRGLKKAVKKAIAEHFAAGRPIAVMDNGKVRKIYPPKGKRKGSSR